MPPNSSLDLFFNNTPDTFLDTSYLKPVVVILLAAQQLSIILSLKNGNFKPTFVISGFLCSLINGLLVFAMMSSDNEPQCTQIWWSSPILVMLAAFVISVALVMITQQLWVLEVHLCLFWAFGLYLFAIEIFSWYSAKQSQPAAPSTSSARQKVRVLHPRRYYQHSV